MGEKAETARLSSFIGAMAVGDLVKSTLGPKGMDKILLGMGRNEGKVEVTNDGATILKNIGVDNPASKVMVDMSRVQDAEVGDGTTSVVVFSSELIREAEKMIEMRIHPQTIAAGWRQATKVARQALESSAKDHGEDAEKFRNDLMNIARTTLSSKILSQHKDFFSKMAVDAVLRLKKSGNLDAIQITKVRGGTLQESFLDEGFLLNKKPGVRQPKKIENARILIANKGVMAIEHADFDGIERLALVTGGEIVSTFGNPDLVKIGKCDLIEQVEIGEETLIKFSGVALGEACSIVLRGATEQTLDEAERSLHDALCVLTSTVKETKTVYGGGCSEMLMANAVLDAAATTAGKEAIAMEAYAKALTELPTIIAENGGYDAAQLVSELRALHKQNKSTMGLNMREGIVGDMGELGITESLSVKRQVIVSASEAAEMILRVDDILKAAPRKRTADHHPC